VSAAGLIDEADNATVRLRINGKDGDGEHVSLILYFPARSADHTRTAIGCACTAAECIHDHCVPNEQETDQ
jgi:hypothetical protein